MKDPEYIEALLAILIGYKTTALICSEVAVGKKPRKIEAQMTLTDKRPIVHFIVTHGDQEVWVSQTLKDAVEAYAELGNG